MTKQNTQIARRPVSEELQKVKAQLAQAEQEITAYDMTMNRQSKLIAELQAQEHGGGPPTSEDALAAREFYESQEDSLLICASDLQHSAIYGNHIEMQSCIRAVASRIAALASVIEDMGCTPLATPMQDARQPLTEDQIGAAVRAAHIAFCLDKFQTFERALVHFTEQAHGIAAQQVKQP